MFNTHRCSICNKTDNEEVATDPEDYTQMTFVPDPSNHMFDICMSCFEDIRDSLYEFEENSRHELKNSRYESEDIDDIEEGDKDEEKDS